MKVLLLKDALKLGKRGQEVETSDGLARNYLIPKKIAVIVGSVASKDFQRGLQRAERQKTKNVKQQKSIATRISGLSVILVGKANKQGHLYAAISPHEVAKVLETVLHEPVDPDRIEISEHIKKVGSFSANYQVGGDKTRFNIVVKPQK